MIRAYLEFTFFMLAAVLLGYLLLWMVGMRPSNKDMFNLWGGNLWDDMQQMRKTPKRKILLGTLMMLIAVALAGFAFHTFRSLPPR